MKSTRTVLCGLAFLIAASLGWAKGKAARVPGSPAQAGSAGQAAPSPILGTLQEEMNREMAVFGKADPPAYFLTYTVTDSDRADVTGSNGALLSSQEQHSRWLEGQIRVGSYALDDTHHVGNQQDGSPGSFGDVVPVDDDAAVLKRAMWRQTDGQYRSAAEAFIKVKTGKDVQVQTLAQAAPDFSEEKPQVYYGPRASFTVDRRPWEDKVRLYTASFRPSAAILNSIVTFTAEANNQYQVNTEGTRLQFGLIHYRLELYIQGKAPDGMDINRYYNFDWNDPSQAPDDKTVLAEEQVLRKELQHDLAARSADRGTHGKFIAAGRVSRQQQIRDIGARDQ